MKLAVCLASLGLLFADAAFEKRFLDMMSHHHEGGIEMAQACQQKAVRAELKQLCSKMASNQGLERQQMMDWLKSWYQDQGGMPKAELEKMMAEHKQHMAKLNTLKGEAFDRAFIGTMINHHQQGVMEARVCTGRADHAELKQLCTKMRGDQEKEIATMRSWIRE